MAGKNASADKTNVMRVLESRHTVYTAHSYDADPTMTGAQIAAILGEPAAFVFKTLVTKAASGAYYVFDIPVAESLDLKKAAKAVGDKSIEMVPVKDLLALTGYIRGGCSPIGMKKHYPTHFDETIQLYDQVAVSAGARGHQIILSPDKLVPFVNGDYFDLIQ
jgi:Cys-tRNA(Pro)/Cys-tRNA(Cys) deacylase